MYLLLQSVLEYMLFLVLQDDDQDKCLLQLYCNSSACEWVIIVSDNNIIMFSFCWELVGNLLNSLLSMVVALSLMLHELGT